METKLSRSIYGRSCVKYVHFVTDWTVNLAAMGNLENCNEWLIKCNVQNVQHIKCYIAFN